MKAYVLIQTTSDAAPIATELRNLTGIDRAHDLQGPYDAIALTTSAGRGLDLQSTLESIKELPGVTRAVVAPIAGTIREPEETEAA